MAILAPLLLPLAAAVAQAPAVASPPPGAHHRGMFISPMGEPFRPSGHDDDTLADWFRQADRNHDGRLTLEEMQQDADRFFALLDVNHDGEIDPDEITHYETVVAPEISGGPHVEFASAEGGGAADGGGRRGSGGHRRGGGGHHGGGGGGFRNNGGGESDRGAARFGLLDLPEPVASADADFNRGVSLAEFRDAAGQRFLALDLDHHGYLTLAGLEMIRPAPPPEPNKPDTVNEAEGVASAPGD
jgi:hypothetical protein